MELINGLEVYRSSDTYYSLAIRLEKDAQQLLALVHEFGENPPQSALSKARKFIIDIEKWKAGCLQQRMGSAAQNQGNKIWAALLCATRAESDIQALHAIMDLKGFGSTTDEDTGQRRAKVATSVLRFLWPDQWGVVDWRVAAMLGLLAKSEWVVDKAVGKARYRRADDYREAFDIIDEYGAIDYITQYRQISRERNTELPRAADVDMAIFGLSLVAWPMR